MIKDSTSNNINSEFIICVDDNGIKSELQEHNVYQVHKIIITSANYADLVHVCFELVGKPGKKYHCGRFKLFAFSSN